MLIDAQALIKSSYLTEDVQFLLKDISTSDLERSTEDREESIQGGRHYSEMLPLETLPSPEYIQLFHQAISQTKKRIGLDIAVLAELIIRKKGNQIVLVSLARAGTPIGILLKRAMKLRGLDVPHYAVSIIRGKGLDLNAIRAINRAHPDKDIQFVDGWTGKGAITETLKASCELFLQTDQIHLQSDLAVLADPGYCATLYGTREDYLIPHACLNATVSGLISRTVLNPDIISQDQFHGAKFYQEWEQFDYSNYYLNEITPFIIDETTMINQQIEKLQREESAFVANWQGVREVKKIAQKHQLIDLNLIKPGIGETTRVFLRRKPYKLIVRTLDNPFLQHIMLLATEKNVLIEVEPTLTYACCGVIKEIKKSENI